MLTRKQTEKYADVMIWGLKKARRLKYKKNDIISLGYELAALPLAESIYHKLIGEGFNVIARAFINETMEYSYYSQAVKKQLSFVGPWEETYCGSLNGSINLYAPENLTHLKDIDPKKMSTAALARKPLREILNKREAKGQFSWTLCTFPTEAPAKQAGLTLRQYTNQIVKACYLNEADPVTKWEEYYQASVDIKKWLNAMKVKYFHIESKNMDLKIYPGVKRQWLGASGCNIPSFELFLSPDFRYTEGTFYADIPSFRSGNYVEKVKLEFKNGEVITALAEKGEDFVHKYLDTDQGACQVGEFALVDKRFSKINKFMADTLFDENFGGRYGSCHIALGACYKDTYKGKQSDIESVEDQKALGFNDSAIHWDLINAEDKVITAHLTNGKSTVIYEKGSFTY